MKTNVTLKTLLKKFFLFPLLIISLFTAAQPDYNFQNPVLYSGSDLQAGAKYRFSGVKSGVDALVTIKSLSPGVSLNQLDATSTGFKEAFQPFIRVDKNTNGFVEFEFTFVKAGLSLPVSMAYVAATPIDVDGSGGLYEQDQINMGGGYVNYDLLNTQLTMGQVGTWFTGKNSSQIEYNGVDTLAKQVMFTVSNTNVTTFTIRIGADNQTTSNPTRQRSVYFRAFYYQNGLLPNAGLLSFTGNRKANAVDLKWQLEKKSRVNNITVEKSINSASFTSIGQAVANSTTGSFSDYEVTPGNVYYRLKMEMNSGKTEYSNVLVFKSANANNNGIKVYPSVVEDQATVQMNVSANTAASIQIVDYAGRVWHQQQQQMAGGSNNITIHGLNKLATGSYIVIVRAEGRAMNQKIFVR